MPKTIDTLVNDIYDLFDGHQIETKNLNKFGDVIEEVLEKRLKEALRNRPPSLYLSNVGQPLRKLWFQIKSGLRPEKLPAESRLKYLYGDLIEAIVIALAIEAGHEVTDQQKEVEVDGVRGRIDCLIDGVLFDVKSAASRSFLKFKDGSLFENDPFGYVAQLKGYQDALKVTRAAWLAVDKERGQLTLLELPPGYPYDIHKKIEVAKQVLEKNQPPDELCYEPIPDGKSGNMKLPVGCSYCDFKYHCHKNLRTFIYSSGPVYLTKVVNTPKVFEIKKGEPENGEK